MQRAEIYQADTGYVLVLPNKCLQASTLETVLSEIRSAFRRDNSKSEQQEPCPYCGSTDTIGHGLREIGKQVLTRRLCKSCSKTSITPDYKSGAYPVRDMGNRLTRRHK